MSGVVVPVLPWLITFNLSLTPSNAQLRRAILERIELAQEQKERIASFTDPRVSAPTHAVLCLNLLLGG